MKRSMAKVLIKTEMKNVINKTEKRRKKEKKKKTHSVD